MSDDQRKCPYCGMAMAADQRACPDCGNPYPFDDDAAMPDAAAPARAGRSSRGSASAGGPGGGMAGRAAPGDGEGNQPASLLARIEQYRTVLVLIGVVVLIVAIGYLLFRFGMSFFEAGRPDPSTLSTTTPGAVVVPSPPALGGSPVPGASPSPGTGGTLIQPSASPSPGAAPGVRLKVANTGGQGANMRQRPSTTAPVVRTLAEGTVVEAIGGDTNAEGRNWRNVRDPNGATGWVASELLAPE